MGGHRNVRMPAHRPLIPGSIPCNVRCAASYSCPAPVRTLREGGRVRRRCALVRPRGRGRQGSQGRSAGCGRRLPASRPTDDGKLVVVRSNGLSSGLFEDDLKVIVGSGLDVLNLPMVESGEEVRRAARVLARLEQAAGVERPIGILANIETPRTAPRRRDRDCGPARRRTPDRLRRPLRAVRHQSVRSRCPELRPHGDPPCGGGGEGSRL